jgi:hypothetical protein
MSDQEHDILERLEGYEILPSLTGADAAALILWTKSGRFQCILGRQAALKLSAAIKTHASADSLESPS